MFSRRGKGPLAWSRKLLTRRTSTELKSINALLVGALDASNVDIAILDASGTIVFVNEAWLTLTERKNGAAGDNPVGSNYFQLVQADSRIDPEVALSTINGIKSVLDGQTLHFEMEYPIKDGPESWYRLNVNRFRDTNLAQVVISHEDITERRIAQQNLLNKREKLRSIYHASSDGILLINSEGIFDCNEKSAKLLGARRPSELYGKQLYNLSHRPSASAAESSAKIQQYIEFVRRIGETRFEVNLARIDGSEFPAEVVLNTFLYDGDLVVQVTFRDITERRVAEQRMQQLNRRLQEDLKARTEAERQIRETAAYLDVYRKIVDTHAIVAETDTTGRILNVNDAFCQISGYTRDELIGQNHSILNSGLHSKEMWQDMYRKVANGGIWHGEICNRAKDGRLYWVDTTIAPLYREDGKLRGYFALRADITSLKIAQVQAEAASRSKSEFLANMSHEIRTPMTAILGYADLLSEIGTCDNCKISSQASAAIETIKRNGEHLLAIINDILDISKIEADKMTVEAVRTDVAKLIDEVMMTMQVKVQAKGLALDCEIESDIPQFVLTDPTRLRQILVNLIGNAIKFTECGQVLVRLACRPSQPELLTISVVDSGIGMSQEHIDRLFQAFEQADTSMTRRFGGTGLGLRISKRLAQMLGGDIEVVSQPGKGSTFTVSISTGSLPSPWIHQQSSQAAREGKPKQVAAEVEAASCQSEAINKSRPRLLEGCRILLVEDGPDNQRLIIHHLKKAGAEVTLACNGKLAVESMTVDGTLAGALAEPLPFDLVLMDMQMPVMDGCEATQLLRRKGANVPILALTAHAMQADLQMCLDAGCNLRITKPIDREQLIETCRSNFNAVAMGPTLIAGSSASAASTQPMPLDRSLALDCLATT